MAYQDLLVPNNLNIYCKTITNFTASADITFTGIWDVPKVATIKFIKEGNVVTCIFPEITGLHGTTNATIQSSAIPSNFAASTLNYAPIVVNTSSGSNMGLCTISTTFKIAADMEGALFVGADGNGILPCVIQYRV